MNFGFNQNVIYNGESYHVQTEDGGSGHPVISTVIFRGGQIVASRRTAYEGMAGQNGMEAAVKELMQAQHLKAVDDLLNGRLHREGG
ncbi:MAG: hypothetical protein HZB83_08075 [Deltaproteobacteria bacterium]|nr:hypothetical protein [Deltaproteobacteria bacterium]